MEDFKNILYPVALTDFSAAVAPYVATLSRQLGAQVHLLHVLRPFEWFVDTYVPEPPKPDFKRIASDFENTILLQAEKRLESFQRKYFKDIKIANATVITGTHYKQILNYVEAEGIDLIMLGTGSTFQKVIFGSVAEKVSKLSAVPVMLIKSGLND